MTIQSDIFMFCEATILANGSVNFFVNPYNSYEQSEKNMATHINKCIKNNCAYFIYSKEKEIILEDKKGNNYKFWIEKKQIS